jgi:hypothetical protein
LWIRYASIKAAIKISPEVRRTFEVLRRIRVFAPKRADMASGMRPSMGISEKAQRPKTSRSAMTGRAFVMVRMRRWRSRRWENATTMFEVCEMTWEKCA